MNKAFGIELLLVPQSLGSRLCATAKQDTSIHEDERQRSDFGQCGQPDEVKNYLVTILDRLSTALSRKLRADFMSVLQSGQ